MYIYHCIIAKSIISQNKLNLNLIGNSNSFSIDVDLENFISDYFSLTVIFIKNGNGISKNAIKATIAKASTYAIKFDCTSICL